MDKKISVKCYNGWGRICYVITQVDKNPTVWGELSIQDINNTAKAHKDHRKAIRRTEDKVLEDRYDIHDDEEIREKSQLLDCVAAIPEITESLPMPEEGNPPITTGVKEHLLQYTTYEATSISRDFLLRSTFLSFFLFLLCNLTPFLYG